ncbi:V-type ATP synthase subunit A [Aromatoleum toluclasticum]|uniref:V-type ATP synthase subunit A n=1 Tax=Aromatoleum toluclasticum TaxID=92003 RepID=UPI001D180D3F|nr:V-type ATP synthase subunit A [Aromatoleum toluclasticum]MCC4115960.1 V-type ATP synthase subunit A [Aromatoleum toluclasticum]
MSRATLISVAGPVLRARCEGGFAIGEAVEVGPRSLLGEVVKLADEVLVAQVYEDTTGLKPGDDLLGKGAPLCVRLGPGLLGGVFDGLLRPLTEQASPFIAPGMRGASKRPFPFVPLVAPGAVLAPGAVFGSAGGERELKCLIPPWAEGEVVEIFPAGAYPEDAPLLVLRAPSGILHRLAMSHDWPVRRPRPVAGRLPADRPLLTGQRVLDALFPVALGGKAAIPGGFGTGKTVLLEALVKACSADIIVYLGCGERGNEMAGALEEISALTDARTGGAMAERTVIVANTSNMPVAAREASIYSAVTIAEYFRDQGLDVALMADSTSRWAEALREVSGRLGELPGEGGYPAYLGARLAEFYERGGRVRTLAGMVGSVTLLGSVSPQAGDFSEPVTSHTTRYVRSFWALDAKRAQARFYPAIHPLQSWSEDAQAVAGWWEQVFAACGGAAEGPDGTWMSLRRRMLTLLDDEARLERMARIVGKDALQPRQRLTLLCAEVIAEAFLRQSALSPNDRLCGPQRQARMLRLLGRFLDLAEAAVARGVTPEAIALLPALRPLQRMGEDIAEGEHEPFVSLETALETQFSALPAGEGRAVETRRGESSDASAT